jgi:hypothetical protein
MHRELHAGEVHVSPTGHRHEGERLFWLYDIHLQAQALQPDQWDRFSALAVAKGLSGVTCKSLGLARDQFRTVVPQEIIKRLNHSKARGRPDRYLRATGFRRDAIEFFCGDLAANSRNIRQSLLPSKEYLLWRFPAARCTWLPYLHIRRWAEGLAKRMNQKKIKR